MALKALRIHNDSSIEHFMTSTAERGGIVSFSYTGQASSGGAIDQAESTVAYVANPSGVKPRGVLMCDVVNNDLTRQHANWHKEEVQVNGKVTVWPQCTVVTNRIMSGHTPLPGQRAFVGHSGLLGNADVATDHTDLTGATRVVGRWVTRKDEDGYAKVQVNLP